MKAWFEAALLQLEQQREGNTDLALSHQLRLGNDTWIFPLPFYRPKQVTWPHLLSRKWEEQSYYLCREQKARNINTKKKALMSANIT